MAEELKHTLVAVTPDEKERARLLQNEANRRSYAKHRAARQIKHREYQRKRCAENPEHVKALLKKWNLANAERIAELRVARRPKYREKERAYSKKWAAENKDKNFAYRRKNIEKWRANCRAWSKANLDKEAARAAKRRAMRNLATPKWADLKEIAKFYAQANRLSRATGIKHHVDHIVPLKGKTVCGLHCEANLRVIPWIENVSKGNKWQ